MTRLTVSRKAALLKYAELSLTLSNQMLEDFLNSVFQGNDCTVTVVPDDTGATGDDILSTMSPAPGGL